MDKVQFIKVKIPGLNVSHDFIVPRTMPVHEVTAMIVQLLHEEYPDAQKPSQPHALLQVASGAALDSNGTLEQFDVYNGETFILL